MDGTDLLGPSSSRLCDAWLKKAVRLLAVALIVGLGISTVFRAAISPIQRTDFTVYQLAGRAVVNETDIYAVRNVRGWAYVDPPPFAILMTPFAGLNVLWGSLVWYVISVVLTASAVRMCVRMVCGGKGLDADPFLLAAIPVFVLLVWLMSGLSRGQASVLMMSLVVAAFYFHWRDLDPLAATCLAGAVLLKVFPLMLLAYFAWRRRWKFVAVTVVMIAVGALLLPAVVFGWQRNLQYLREWGQIVAKPALETRTVREQSELNEQLLDPAKPRNQSLEAALWRLTGGAGSRPLAIGIGLAAATAIWLVGRRVRPDSEMFIAGASLIWMLLVPPVSESHYFVMLLWPVTLVTYVAGDRRDAFLQIVARVTLTVFTAVGVLTVCFSSLQKYGLLCWASLGLLGVLLLAAVRESSLLPAAKPL